MSMSSDDRSFSTTDRHHHGQHRRFDPLSEDRAGDPVSHIPLQQRGKVIQQMREQQRRKGSYSASTRSVSQALLGNSTGSTTGASARMRQQSSRRLIMLASESPTAPTAPSDTEPHATIAESLSIDQLCVTARGNGKDNGHDGGGMLTKSAVLALWTHVRVAMGFRQWTHATRGPADLARIDSNTDLNGEARRILTSAEFARLAALHTAVKATTSPTTDITTTMTDAVDGSGAQEEPLVSPRVLDTTGIRLSRAELDLLLVWARQIQVKTFRSVDDASICEAMRFLRFRSYQDGDSLFYEGEVGETFYIIFQGTVAVFVDMPLSTKSTMPLTPRCAQTTRPKLDWTQLGRRVFTYRTADSFGETAMFSDDATRTASAIAVGPCEICELHRDIYRRTLRKYHQQFFEQAQKLNFLQRVPLFRDLQRPKLTLLADLLEKKRFCFGDVITTEKASLLDACFLVLSGVVKLTQSVELPCCSSNETCLTTPHKTNKTKPVMRMKMELQTVVSNEILALEALLDAHNAPRASYCATVASAHVELYVLKESDARAFVGGAQSAMGQRIREICASEAAHRERRRAHARHTLLTSRQGAVEDARDAAARIPGTSRHNDNGYETTTRGDDPRLETDGDSLDAVAASPESPRTRPYHPGIARTASSSCGPVGAGVPGLQCARVPPAFSDGGPVAPYLPNLRATHLFPSGGGYDGLLLSPRTCAPPPAVAISTGSLGSIVSSPKMLSSCVRNFLFEHSETLASGYVERLRHQFPTPPATGIVATGGESNGGGCTSRTQRDEQRVLAQQLSKMYDKKMHWDPKKRDFVLAAAESGTSTASRSSTSSTRVGYLSSTPRGSAAGTGSTTTYPAPKDAVAPSSVVSVARPPSGEKQPQRQSSFHQELRSTQQAARKLVETHMRRVGQKQNHSDTATGDSTSSSRGGDGSFLHFFADV